MRFYHGTDYVSGMNIMSNGFNPQKKVWTCSKSNMVYLVSEKYNDGNGELFQDLNAVRMAVEAGQIAAAHVNQTESSILIFELNIPDTIVLDEDKSCENMFDCYQIESDKLNDLIEKGIIKLTAYKMTNSYVSYLRVFYLKNLDKRLYKNDDASLMSILNDLSNVETYWFYDDYLGVYDDFYIEREGEWYERNC